MQSTTDRVHVIRMCSMEREECFRRTNVTCRMKRRLANFRVDSLAICPGVRGIPVLLMEARSSVPFFGCAQYILTFLQCDDPRVNHQPWLNVLYMRAMSWGLVAKPLQSSLYMISSTLMYGSQGGATLLYLCCSARGRGLQDSCAVGVLFARIWCVHTLGWHICQLPLSRLGNLRGALCMDLPVRRGIPRISRMS